MTNYETYPYYFFSKMRYAYDTAQYHTSKAYLKQLKKAQKEFRRKNKANIK